VNLCCFGFIIVPYVCAVGFIEPVMFVNFWIEYVSLLSQKVECYFLMEGLFE